MVYQNRHQLSCELLLLEIKCPYLSSMNDEKYFLVSFLIQILTIHNITEIHNQLILSPTKPSNDKPKYDIVL